MTDLENGYAIVEGVYGNLIIYKDDKPFIPTNLEPMDETDEAWERIGEIVDALNDDCEAARAQGRIEGLQEALDVVDGNPIVEGTAIADDLEAAIRVRIQELQGKSE